MVLTLLLCSLRLLCERREERRVVMSWWRERKGGALNSPCSYTISGARLEPRPLVWCVGGCLLRTHAPDSAWGPCGAAWKWRIAFVECVSRSLPWPQYRARVQAARRSSQETRVLDVLGNGAPKRSTRSSSEPGFPCNASASLLTQFILHTSPLNIESLQ